MIAILSDDGKTMYIQIRHDAVEFIVEGHVRMRVSKDDARQLRDYLGYLG